MAKANVTEHCLKMEIPEISKLNEIWSPKILIHGIPWKVQVCKEETEKRRSLGVYLVCREKDKSPVWPLWGSASFKLVPFSDKVKPVECHCSPFVFDNSTGGFGDQFEWDAMFDKTNSFVENDTINLEIHVKAENPNDPKRSGLNFKCIHKCCDNGNLATYRLTVTNIVNMMAVRSPKFKLCGLSWNVLISNEHPSYLGVALQLEEDTGNVSCNVAISIRLVSSKNDVHPIEKCDTRQYYHSMDFNAVKVVSLDELMKSKSGFVNENSIILEIELNADKPVIDDTSDLPNAKRAKLNLTKGAKSVLMECAVCLECIDNQDLASTQCGHLFCFECIEKEATNRGKCPTCTTPVQKNNLRQLYLPV